jgi:hypothetical protein
MPCSPYLPRLVHANHTWRRVNIYEVSRYSALQPPDPSYLLFLNMFFNTLFSILPVMLETKFRTHTEPQAKL